MVVVVVVVVVRYGLGYRIVAAGAYIHTTRYRVV